MTFYGRVWRMLAGDRVGGERKEDGYGLEGTRNLATEKGRVGRKGAWVESLDQWSWEELEEMEELLRWEMLRGKLKELCSRRIWTCSV